MSVLSVLSALSAFELEELPEELAEKIFRDLRITEVEKFCAGRAKSSLVYRLCFDQHSWKYFTQRDFSEFFDLQEPQDWREYYYSLLDQCLIANGHLAIKGYDMYQAIEDNDFLAVKHLYKDQIFGSDSYYEAAKHGNMDILKFMYQKGVEVFDESLLRNPEKAEDYKEFLKTNPSKDKISRWMGIFWYPEVCAIAAKRGHLDILQFLIEHGCPIDETAAAYAAKYDHFDCLKYLVEDAKAPYDSLILINAAESGNVEMTEWTMRFVDVGAWGTAACIGAAKNGHIPVMKLFFDEGTERSPGICDAAAEGYQWLALEYAHSEGCDWDENTCVAASEHGSLECLRGLHENGCPWNSNTTISAVRYNRMSCFIYAYENGCPTDFTVYTTSSYVRGDDNSTVYVNDHGKMSSSVPLNKEFLEYLRDINLLV